jgi:hypothetical protein
MADGCGRPPQPDTGDLAGGGFATPDNQPEGKVMMDLCPWFRKTIRKPAQAI